MRSNRRQALTRGQAALSSDKPGQIERRRRHVAQSQQRGCLAAIMRLMVEHMPERQTQRRLKSVTPPIAVHERLIEHCFREAGDDIAQMRVFRNTCHLEANQIGVKDLVKGEVWRGPSLNPGQPDPVGDQHMVQSCVDRAESRAPFTEIFALTQSSAGPINAPVGPGVVPREGHEIFAGHRDVPAQENLFDISRCGWATHGLSPPTEKLGTMGSMDEITIRLARSGDARGIARLDIETWRTTYAGMLSASYLVGLSERRRETGWRMVILREPRDVRVAVDRAGMIVGYGSCGPSRSERRFPGEVFTLYVAPDQQNQGIGRRLLLALFRRLVASGLDAAIIWVLRDNPARFFYERLGGRQVGHKPVAVGGSQVQALAYGWADLPAFLGAVSREDREPES